MGTGIGKIKLLLYGWRISRETGMVLSPMCHNRTDCATSRQERAFRWFSSLLLWLLLPLQTAAQGAEQTLRLQLKWHHQFQYAGFYAAVEKGFYREAGLDVVLAEGGAQLSVLDAVLDNGAHFGIGDADLLLARKQGRPVVLLANIMQHSPSIILTRRDSGIDTPADLAGRTLMLTHGRAEITSLLHSVGVRLDAVNIIPNTGRVDDLIEGRADAMFAYASNEPYRLRQQGVDYTVLYPGEYDVEFLGDNIFTSASEVAEHPERVAAFVRASLQGWEYALSHIDEMVELILHMPGVQERGVTREQLRFEAAEIRRLIDPELVAIGHINQRRWEHIANILGHQQLFPLGMSLEGFFYQPSEANVLLQPWVLLIIAAVLLVIAAGILVWNIQLRRAVAAHTMKLEEEIALHRQSTGFLRDSEAQQRALLRAMPDIMFVTDSEGTFLRYHGDKDALLYTVSNDFLGKRVCDVMPEEFSEQVMQEHHQVLEHGGIIVHEYQLPINGELKHFERRVVRQDEDRVLTIIRDISDRKLIEEQYRRLYREYLAIADNVPDVIVKLDRQGNMVWWNKILEARTGYGAGQIKNRSAMEFIDERDRERVKAAIGEAFAKGEAEVTALAINVSGPRPVNYRAVVLRDDNGEVTGLLAVGHDITEIVRSEERARQLLLQNRSLTRQLFNVQEALQRHLAQELHDEFGQWLTAIQAEAMAIRTQNKNKIESIDTGAEAIERSATQMHQAIRNLIHQLRPGVLDELGLADSLQELISTCQAHHPEIHYQLEIADNLEPLDDQYAITIYRVVQESLTNVAKHSGASEVQVRLLRDRDDACDEYVRVVVEDNGQGIHSEVQGKGFGLAGIRERVLAAEGVFELTRSRGGGVQLTVQVPLQGGAEEEGYFERALGSVGSGIKPDEL